MGEAIALAGPAMSAAGSIVGGMQQKNAAKVNAIRLQTAAEAGKVRAIETDAAYREELSSAIQNIESIRSAQNVAFDSPTSFALVDKAQAINARARKVAVSNERMKALGLEGDSAMAAKGANQYMISGILNAGDKIASAGQKLWEKVK